jgi:hypothetical protein
LHNLVLTFDLVVSYYRCLMVADDTFPQCRLSRIQVPV